MSVHTRAFAVAFCFLIISHPCAAIVKPNCCTDVVSHLEQADDKSTSQKHRNPNSALY